MRFPLPIFKAARTLPKLNGHNTLLTATVDPEAVHPIAVAAQEIAEARYKLYRVGGALAASVAILAATAMAGLPSALAFAAVLPVLAVLIWLRSGPGNRSLELWGHEVEVQAAVEFYGADEARKRRSEAAGMVAYDGYHFDDWTPSEVVEGMRKHTKAARRWVETHEADLAHAEKVLAD